MKKPLNITVSESSRKTAEKLVKHSGCGSVSKLFEQLVAEEFDRDAEEIADASSVDATSWSVPATWSAMLATMPLAEAPFRALASSPLARSAFRKATAPRSGRIEFKAGLPHRRPEQHLGGEP